jgi:hypothetical protein
MTKDQFERDFAPLVARLTGGGGAEICERGTLLIARSDLSAIPIEAYCDSLGVALIDPPTRKNHPASCQACVRLAHCEAASVEMTPALAWRRLGLVEADGRPTRRGVIFSFFNRGEGLAIASALEDASYAGSDLIYDVANLRAGHRFSAGGENVSGGRIGWLCARAYERAEFPGYLESGVPPHYGDGASQIVRELQQDPAQRFRFVTETIRPGDLERVITEWRSLVRQIAQAPDLEWDRWQQFQQAARDLAHPAVSPVTAGFPPLSPAQRQLRAHRLGASPGKLIA